MEPVTHILTGACLARTGFNRKAAYATLTMAVAAELPDIDTLWSLRGPVEGFQHHRGITHTFLGLPFEAAFLVAAVYGYHRWRVARAGRQFAALPPDPSRTMKPLTPAPVRWGLLYGFALVGLLSHLLLDYTNNYGLRPFFPFNDHWYAASIVFIFDPAIFGLLLVAVVVPSLFSLIGSEIGARRMPFKGRGWAIAALLSVVALWSFRAVEHSKAVDLAMAQSITAPAEQRLGGLVPLDSSEAPATDVDTVPPAPPPVYLGAQRALASPDPLNPFHWTTATDFGVLYQLAEVDTLNGALTPGDTTFPKPSRDADVLIAERTWLGRAYMDWSPMPIIDVSKPDSNLPSLTRGDPGDPDDAGLTIVSFRDPRFMGGWMREMGRSPLQGEVAVTAAGKAVRQTMDGRVER
jgi:inner membrane protein